MDADIINEINNLKLKNDVQILAHFYEDGPIQDIADYVGDSLYLAQMGEKSSAKTILLAGVVFMAESAKILSPSKRILVPDLNAGCSLVDHSPFEQYKRWRLKYPEAILISYVNCSAEVKSISDVICTSSNAEKIVNSIPKDRKILFGPDRNLGGYLSKKLNRKFDLWPGACEVHVLFSARKLYELKKDHPDAVVLAHPECLEEVLEYADVIGSTSRLIQEVDHNNSTKFIVATESGVFHQMRKLRPDVQLIQAPAEGSCACNQCPYMKLNTLKKIKMALENLSPEIIVDEKIIASAKLSLHRMMAITRGENVIWPKRFELVQ